MESRAPKTTSRANKTHRNSGFTLVEVLLVVAIIGMVMSLGLPAISNVTGHRLASTTRQFVGLIRTIRNDSILLNQAHRLVINLDKNSYWVENQTRDGLLNEVEDPTKYKKGEAPPSQFNISPKYTKEPREMPGGVVFTGVYKEKEGLRDTGIVFIHFFPNGINDQAILYLAKAGSPESAYSLIVRPTSGRVDIAREIVKDFNASYQQ